MVGSPHRSRRGLLSSLASVAIGVLATVAVVGRTGLHDDSERTSDQYNTLEGTDQSGGGTITASTDHVGGPGLCSPRPITPGKTLEQPKAFEAIVDRFVDKRETVLVLFDDGVLFDEVALPTDAYPCLEVGDRLIVVLSNGEPIRIWFRADLGVGDAVSPRRGRE